MLKIDQTTYPWIHLNKRNLPVPVSTLENAGDRRNSPAKVQPAIFSDQKSFFEQACLPQSTIRAKTNSILFLFSCPFYPYQELYKW
jgi:hypothetical protein